MKTKEFKLGGFILGALLLLFVLVFSVRDFRIFNPSYRIKVVFNFADGIKPASPVRVAGVDAGEVKKIAIREINAKTQILVELALNNDIKIPKNSDIFVNSLGLLGERYLEIMPRDNKDGYLKPGDTIQGEDSIPLFQISNTVQESLNELKEVLSAIKEIVGDQATTQNLKSSLRNLESASFEANNILQSLNDSEGTLGKLLYKDDLYQTLEEFVQDIKQNPWKLLHVPRNKR
jgi:phospholipid/cholesterol/gamma-HCH transport system substrate-binding protein